MSPLIWTFTAVLVVYITVGSLIAYLSRRHGVKSSRDYFVSSYRLGWFLSSMTYAATTYSAFMMVGLVGLTYTSGIGALGFELAYLLVTVVILAILGPRVWSMARERGWVSPSEMLSDLYGSKLIGYVITIIYLIAMVPYVSAQVIGAATIFEGLGLGYEVGVVVVAVLVLAWIALAGMWSVATTDAYQGLWMLSAALLLVFLLTNRLIPNSGITITQLNEVLGKGGLLGLTDFWSFQTFLAYTMPWLFFAVTNPQVVVRLYVPKDRASYKRSVLLFSIFGFTYTLAVVYVGLVARGLVELGLLESITVPDLVTSKLLSSLEPVLASFIYMSIIAAAVSTANSIILAVASSFVRDVIESRGKPDLNTYRISNVIVAALTLISSTLAFMKVGFVVDLSVLTSVLLLPLAPVTIVAWITPHASRKRPVKVASLLSILAGFAVAITHASILGPRRTFLTSYYGVPVSVLVLMVATAVMLAGFTALKLREKVLTSDVYA
ncbi:MAG: sodium:solute symporter family protein [Zestosphaera sp.]